MRDASCKCLSFTSIFSLAIRPENLEQFWTETAPTTPTVGVCATPPAKFTLDTPEHQTTVSRLRPQLKWNASECADSYRVIIKARGSGDVLFEIGDLTELKYRTDTLERGKRYLWQVIAVNAFGETASEERVFRTSLDGNE